MSFEHAHLSEQGHAMAAASLGGAQKDHTDLSKILKQDPEIIITAKPHR